MLFFGAYELVMHTHRTRTHTHTWRERERERDKFSYDNAVTVDMADVLYAYHRSTTVSHRGFVRLLN